MIPLGLCTVTAERLAEIAAEFGVDPTDLAEWDLQVIVIAQLLVVGEPTAEPGHWLDRLTLAVEGRRLARRLFIEARS